MKSKKEKIKKDQLTAVLEDVNEKFDLILENVDGLNKKMDREIGGLRKEFVEFKGDMNGFRKEMYGFRGEMCEFKDEMYEFRDEMYEFKINTESNFKSISDHLFRIENRLDEIEDQLKNLGEDKVDKKNKGYLFLTGEITRIGKELEIIKARLKIKIA